MIINKSFVVKKVVGSDAFMTEYGMKTKTFVIAERQGRERELQIWGKTKQAFNEGDFIIILKGKDNGNFIEVSDFEQNIKKF